MEVNYVVQLVSDSIKGNGIVGFANLDEKSFRVNVFENNKLVLSKIVPDSLGLFNKAFLSSAPQIKKFDAGCEVEEVTRITLPDGSDSVIIVKSLGNPRNPKTGCPSTNKRESLWEKFTDWLDGIKRDLRDFFSGGGGGGGGFSPYNPPTDSPIYGIDFWSFFGSGYFNTGPGGGFGVGIGGAGGGGGTSLIGPGTPWVPFPIPSGMVGVATLLGIDALYPELNSQILDENVRIEYKQNYLALVELHNQRISDGLIVDLYAGMSSKEFIDLLKNNQLLALNIDPITILVKAGASGAADILVQMFFARLLDDNVSDWNEALTKVNWWQVGLTMATGALPISNKYILAAVNAGSAVFAELGKNGFTSWEKLGSSFVEGFMGSIIGSSLGDLIADKFANIGNLGRRLITKFEGIFSYETICRWLGGGISNVSESLLTNKGIIASTRKIIGWGGPDKVAVIGRYMEDRVIPYANKMGAAYFDKNNPIAAPFFTQEVLEDISKLNRDWGNNWPKNKKRLLDSTIKFITKSDRIYIPKY